MSPAASKRIAQSAYVFTYLLAVAFGLWPISHIAALVAAPVGVIFLLLADRKLSPGLVAAIVTVLAAGSVALFVFVPPVPSEEAEIQLRPEWLLPGHEQTPLSPCDKWSSRLSSGYAIMFAGDGAFTLSLLEKRSLLTAGSCVALSGEIVGEGALFDADVYDFNDELVAHIQGSDFQLIQGKSAYQERAQDRPRLTVYKKKGGGLLLDIRYVNPGAIRVSGRFACPDGVHVEIAENGKITFGERGGPVQAATFAGECHSHLNGPVFKKYGYSLN